MSLARTEAERVEIKASIDWVPCHLRSNMGQELKWVPRRPSKREDGEPIVGLVLYRPSKISLGIGPPSRKTPNGRVTHRGIG